ncbi:hypothetical protein C5167_008797 [Papaver somniferum]|uniref:Reverse transcriptase domain-containing protein n=1 Tax=Papaver somniferum TaxID=3469 RepID=A0A4Y7JYI1_PAPSO|nr:hypothetical protein C5167_008797 [Papaver somniferum]
MVYISWEEYKDKLYARFGDNQYMDFFGELSKLSQTSTVGGTVQDFREKFEKLLAKVGPIPQHQQVSMFISGLDVSIRTDVQANKPTTLSSTIGLTRLFEAINSSNKRVTPSVPKIIMQPRNTHVNSSSTPIRRMMIEEINERKRKGFCFKCNEKFVPGHRCKKLFSIQANLEDGDDDVEIEVEEIGDDQDDEVTEISLHAISSSQTPETMRVMGKLGLKPVTVLIDSGSTHNFVCERIAEKIGLHPIPKGKLEVIVATRERVSSSGICLQTQLTLQGVPISVDVYLLPLEVYEVVLGTQWLRTLGPIEWDFSKIKMKFKVDGKEVALHGLSTPENKMVDSPNLLRAAKKNKEVLLHLCSFTASQSPREMCQAPIELQQLLAKHKKVLTQPKTLPPRRLEDRRIPLQPGCGLVSVKTYRYPHFEKTEIEKIVSEMLSSGVIRPSNSPYSSPVILVKKNDGSWRMCIDYRALIVLDSVKDKFHIPVIDELLDELNGAIFFTKLDLRFGYHQVCVHLDDIEKTAYRTHQGHYEFLVMPFGLTNAPSTFQSLMNEREVKYLDHIISSA